MYIFNFNGEFICSLYFELDILNAISKQGLDLNSRLSLFKDEIVDNCKQDNLIYSLNCPSYIYYMHLTDKKAIFD
jgi:hypothetical protein